jgi:hypothetical protein
MDVKVGMKNCIYADAPLEEEVAGAGAGAVLGKSSSYPEPMMDITLGFSLKDGFRYAAFVFLRLSRILVRSSSSILVRGTWRPLGQESLSLVQVMPIVIKSKQYLFLQ